MITLKKYRQEGIHITAAFIGPTAQLGAVDTYDLVYDSSYDTDYDLVPNVSSMTNFILLKCVARRLK
jgi:hypothetical protein